MFKNSLLIKIILIFTIPAIGILFFSTKLVMEKFDFSKAISRTIDSSNYMDRASSLLHSIQKERGLSVCFVESEKFENLLREQRKVTDKRFNDYLNYSKIFLTKSKVNYNIEIFVKSIQNNFYNFKDLRGMVNEKEIDSFELIDKYSKQNDLLLNTISASIKNINVSSFNSEYLNLYYFLMYKEQEGLKRALISKISANNEIDKRLLDRLNKVKIVQNNSLNEFKRNASIKLQEIFNKKLSWEIEHKVLKIENMIFKTPNEIDIDLDYWWDLSTQKMDLLDSAFSLMLMHLNEISSSESKNAFIEQNISVFYLFISFVTLLSLFFILRAIIINEQKTYKKIEKQKKIHELLNQTNKSLLKRDKKEDLYEKINKIISKNPSTVFSFIYDIEAFSNKDIVYAQEGTLKKTVEDVILNSNGKENLLTRCIDWKTNILIEDFSKSNISIFSDEAKKYGIKSAGAFPIKKFDKIVSILFIYSNEINYFDHELEILFDQLILDISHLLEKFEYEKIRKSQEQQLKISSIAFESSEPMLITDESSQIIEVNQAFCDVMGYTKENLIGRNPNIFRSQHHDIDFFTNMWLRLNKDNSWSGEIYNKKYDGTTIPFRLTITTIRNDKDEITHYLGQFIDISDIKDREQVLQYQATHDNLTGLPNRLLLLDRIEHAITKVVRHKIVGGLIFIDLDNFKTINDTLGHDIGDELLIQVSKKLKQAIRDEDTVSRIGGDEFIVLADNLGSSNEDGRKNIDILARKIKDTLNSIEYIHGFKNISTPSIGVTLFSDSSVSVNDIIKQADTAMYAAKKQGKNSIEFFN